MALGVDQIVHFRPEEADEMRVAVVMLMTCAHRDGLGHRFKVNPTGASLTIHTTSSGRKCLTDKGVRQAVLQV